MNAMDTQRLINQRMGLIRSGNRSGNHCGCFRFYVGKKRGVTWEHELRKFQICWELKKRGHEFLTEAIFESGKRADVVDLTRGVIYEILHTESVKSFKEKIEEYPREFEIRAVSSTKPFGQEMLD